MQPTMPTDERGLPGERSHRRGHGPRRDAREIAEERSAVQAPRPEPLRDRQYDLAVRHAGHDE
jgi:hypothetical protein